MSRPTIRKGRRELESGGAEAGRIRRAGAGRPGIEQSQPGIKQALEKFVDPVTRGDPQSPLRWTCKSRAKLAAALTNAGWKVSSTTVGRLLHELGYRLQSVRKSTEGASHPDRNAQFEHINAKADEFLQRAQPVVSVDTKKKELVGDFKNAGREWQPKGQPEKSLVHDFPQDAAGKAIPGCDEVLHDCIHIGTRVRNGMIRRVTEHGAAAKRCLISTDGQYARIPALPSRSSLKH